MLIGLTGKAGSGKSFAANHLVELHGFTRMKFADPIKDMLRVLGLTDDHIEGHMKEEPSAVLCGKSPRRAMQTLGTEWGRNIIGDTIWISQFRRRVAKSSADRIVCDDVRFPNEVTAIKEVGGFIIHIGVLDAITPVVEHTSEQYALPYDFDLPNDFTDEFKKKIDRLL